MKNEEILRYVKQTPYNTNKAILKQLLGNEGPKVEFALEYIERNPWSPNLTIFEQLVNDARGPVLEGDGQEFYTLAPTALTFRSTAPLNELQEVQINGVTVDPSNYTLEEGSTIVTFPIEYLNTLNVGGYKVAVVSDSESAKGGFTVVQPEVNKYGFYYNQPYVGKEDSLDDFYMALTFYEDGICEYVQCGTEHKMVFSFKVMAFSAFGESFGVPQEELEVVAEYFGITDLNAETFIVGDSNGEPLPIGIIMSQNEIQTLISDNNVFSCVNEYYFSDNEYVYNWDDTNQAYSVRILDDNKTEYTPVRVNVYDKQVALNNTYRDCENLTNITIPHGISVVGDNAFSNCPALESIHLPSSISHFGDNAFVLPLGKNHVPYSVYYNGTITQWLNIDFNGSFCNPCIYGADLYINGELVNALNLPDGISEIGTAVFMGCGSLTSIVIPVSVEEIHNIAFANCNNLRNIIFNGTIAQWSAITLGVNWNMNIPATHVQCSDGTVTL